MKVVFHVDELPKWPEAKANINNLLEAVPHTEVVLTVNGGAIVGFVDQAYAGFIADSRVTFHACHNAMKAHQLTKEQLPAKVIVVPAGVLDLIQLQHQGYAYIKP